MRNSTKETRKKKKGADEAAADDDEPVMSEDEKQAIADQAAFQAKPFTLADAMVTLATKAEFGDYQVNAAMGLSRSVGMNPQESARQIVEKMLPVKGEYMEEPEIAGPGFINLRFKKEYLFFTHADSEIRRWVQLCNDRSCGYSASCGNGVRGWG